MEFGTQEKHSSPQRMASWRETRKCLRKLWTGVHPTGVGRRQRRAPEGQGGGTPPPQRGKHRRDMQRRNAPDHTSAGRVCLQGGAVYRGLALPSSPGWAFFVMSGVPLLHIILNWAHSPPTLWRHPPHPHPTPAAHTLFFGFGSGFVYKELIPKGGEGSGWVQQRAPYSNLIFCQPNFGSRFFLA